MNEGKPFKKEEATMEEKANMGLSLDRLEALTDGVVAIAITLLVLIIDTPPPNKENLLKCLWERGHVFIAYLISFVLICIYWWRHHIIFHYLKKTDKTLTLLNLLLLLCICFIPFPTDLVVEYFKDPQLEIAVLIYSGVHLICSLLLYIIWWVATYQCRLVSKDLSPAIITNTKKMLLSYVVIYAVSIGISTISAVAALSICALIPIINLLPHSEGIDVVDLSKYVK